MTTNDDGLDALLSALDRFRAMVDATTVSAEGGGRSVLRGPHAIALSEAAEALNSEAAAAMARLVRPHCKPADPADGGCSVSIVGVGGDGVDAALSAALRDVLGVTARPIVNLEGVRPSEQHLRFRRGDVVTAADLAALERADKILRLSASAAPATAVEGGDARPPAFPSGVPLTADHESILSVLGKTPTKCKTVIDVASAGTIRNRETVGRLLGELAGFGMVDRPHGKRKGYALTDEGRKRLPGASPT